MKKTLVASACMLSATYAATVSAFEDITASSLTATQGFSVVGAAASDGVGYTVTNAGDINADGKDDLLITTSGDKAYIVFGTGAARSAVVYDLADTTTNTDFVTLTVTSAAGLVGAAAGDINDDDVDDIVIGVPGVAGTDNGQAYVVYGKSGIADLTLDSMTVGTDGFSFTNTADNFGSAVAAGGDIDGDGIDDLVISAPNGDGAVIVILGSSSRTADVVVTDLATTPDGFEITGTNSAGGNFGTSVVSIGDVNGDDLDDILVGAPGENAAYIVYGIPTTDVATATIDLTDVLTYAKISGVTGSLGQAVAVAGDFNAGGKDDLIIAAPDSGAGIVYVIFGEQLTLDTTNTEDIVDIDLSSLGTTAISITGATSGDQLGYAVAGVDDVNDDDVDDIVLTAFGAGKAYVLFGSTSIASIDLSTTLASTAGVTISGTTAGEFGQSVSGLEDITGDGIADFVIGAPALSPTVDSTERSGAGGAYVIYGVAQTEDDSSAFRLGASISLIAGFLGALMI